MVLVPSSSEVELYPPDSPRPSVEHPSATALRKPDMGYLVKRGERLGWPEGCTADNNVAFIASPPRYAIPDLLIQLKSSRGKNGELCWMKLGYRISLNFSRSFMKDSLIGKRSMSNPILKSTLDAAVISLESAEIDNSTGISSTPTLMSVWNVPANLNSVMSLVFFFRSIGRRVLLASR